MKINYNIRCWTYETSILLDTEVNNELPFNDYFEYFGPDFQLHPDFGSKFENMNSKQYLENIKVFIYIFLRK